MALIRRRQRLVRHLTERAIERALRRVGKGIDERARADSEEDDDIMVLVAAIRAAREIVEAASPVDEEELREMALSLQLRSLRRVDRFVSHVATVQFLPPYLGGQELIGGWVRDNVALIRSIDQRYHDDLERVLERQIRRGLSTRDLGAVITERYGVSARAGARIARDQTQKLHSQVSGHRYSALGIAEYIWRHVKDERVRGNPMGQYPDARVSHWQLEGQVFAMSGPGHPIDGHPGMAVECRCRREPVLSRDSKERLQAYDRASTAAAARRGRAAEALLGLPRRQQIGG